MISVTSSAPRSRLHLLRRANARFSVASLAGLLACAQFSVARAEGDAAGQRPAKRQGLSADTERRPGPFGIFDTDRDGTLSAAEIAAASDVIRRHDRNGDGRLTGDEMHPRPPRPSRPPGDDDAGGDDFPPLPPSAPEHP